jgi:hypothetical protein
MVEKKPLNGASGIPEKQAALAVALAWTDAAFHAKLLANPRDALAEIGHVVPAGVTISVLEDGPENIHFVIPQKPAELKILGSVNTAMAGSGSSSCSCGKCDDHKCHTE